MITKIAIHSVPRSGSTWLGELFNSHPNVAYKYQPLFSYTFKSRLSSKSSLKDIDLFFEDIAFSKDEFLNQNEAREIGKLPKFNQKENFNAVVYKEVRYHHILQNMLSKDDNVKVIGLIRNPLSVINSWLKAPKEFRKDLGWNELEEWRFAKKKNQEKIEEFNGFEKWKEVANLFLTLERDFPNQFKIVEYKDLIINTESVVKDVFSFCSLSYSEQTQNFISQSKANNNKDAYSVYKTKSIDNKWKTELNTEIANLIQNNLKHTILEKYI